MNLVHPLVLENADRLAASFTSAKPFRHIVIENFFDDATCSKLLSEFPAFERGNARNEAGELGAKSTVERIRGIGQVYASLDDLIQTRPFLDLIGRITGIPNLLYDPWYFGGGTHENREGQDLDPHVDFNRHPVERWHRRLNLIVYLNHEWDDAWGGSLELHSDPRSPHDQVECVTPLYNRAVIFETTETSWHGFSRIQLPPERRQLSRRSIALYFYTTERPQPELADTHSTIYVDRPLPDRFQPGYMLTKNDLEEMRTLLARRDQHNQRLYGDLTALTKQLELRQYGGLFGYLHHVGRRLLAHWRHRSKH
ncbi:MAG: 2OG-Fe(II) oxygenase [Rudaea sp.]